MTTWRDKARPIIAAVILRVGTADEAALRAALREAYPWGSREYHPYRIWCDEISVQLGRKKPKVAFEGTKESPQGQQELFT